MAASPQPNSRKTAVQLRILLIDVAPAIWRRLLVPGEIELSKFHSIFQVAMGWKNCHLHYFEINDQRYSMPDPEWDDDDIDESTVTFSDLVETGSRFFYEYDLGDCWRHEVVVESMDPVLQILKFAACIDGQRACPPEDCGGTSGYAELLEAIGNPDNETHADYLKWAGGAFDPELFDLVAINAALQRVR